MGILSRFKDIMSSNINALLDKAEDPEKMIDQCLRNLNSDLGKVKSETASIMAEEQRAKRTLDECNEDITKMQNYAVKALESGNEGDARKFLEKKASLSGKLADLQKSYEMANTNATRMKEMHDKLVKDIGELEARKDMIKGKIAVAKTQERINSIGSSISSANNSISAFDRMEEKAERMLDKANAMAELNSSSEDDIEDLAAKYSNSSSTDIDAELSALKANLGN
ncbi:phage shock protein A (PspA) family protein [Mobilisporobacter senegalensis]|uniref:Phage shock protein A (PspA) family protein n=1 Tax=Mobilisporobacter senegalensis TaxID=1329262 RepID=A0A3N1XZP1_9FIRM|nr:PspA/IM30 family protein [Mobilisporobacter senegalensis]ROR31711.1 phage shock protein A (PspA) family protein [Mobilisporobacter senegalensis]